MSRRDWAILIGAWVLGVLATAGAVLYFLALLVAAGAVSISLGIVDLATLVGALVAVTALFLGWYQLRGSTLQARATVLLSLDQRWEVELDGARKALYALVDRVTAVGAPATPALFEAELARLRTSGTSADREEYRALFRVVGFFETVAYATRSGYIRIGDVDNLLGGSIRHTELVFGREIAALQQADRRIYEHWSWLAAEVRKRDGMA